MPPTRPSTQRSRPRPPRSSAAPSSRGIRGRTTRGPGTRSPARLRRGREPVGRDPALVAGADGDPRALSRACRPRSSPGGITRRQGRARHAPGGPRPSLPARRDHPVGRLPRRLLQALAAGRQPAGGGLHRVLRRALHGRERRHPRRPTISAWSCRTSPPAARWPTWRTRRRCSSCWTRSSAEVGSATGADVGARDVHELVRRTQGVLRGARRHRVHVVERRARGRVGVRARRARALLPRRASRAQHRREARHPGRRDGGVGSRGARSAATPSEALRRARLILWRGWCSVHARFTVAQIDKARREHPGITVIVHPECRREVVDAADLDGSTELIIETIASAPAGSRWAVGTEINLVNRLAAEHPDKLIFCLDPVICPCSTMYRIHPAYLAWVLEALVEGRVLNEIVVDDAVKSARARRARPHARRCRRRRGSRPARGSRPWHAALAPRTRRSTQVRDDHPARARRGHRAGATSRPTTACPPISDRARCSSQAGRRAVRRPRLRRDDGAWSNPAVEVAIVLGDGAHVATGRRRGARIEGPTRGAPHGRAHGAELRPAHERHRDDDRGVRRAALRGCPRGWWTRARRRRGCACSRSTPSASAAATTIASTWPTPCC